MGTLLLDKWNTDWIAMGDLPAASGAIMSEMKLITFSHSIMEFLDRGTSSYVDFEILISNYNMCNSYSLVAHPDGLHCKYFGSNKASENKVVLVNKS